jgi:FkbM family methyltransferase
MNFNKFIWALKTLRRSKVKNWVKASIAFATGKKIIKAVYEDDTFYFPNEDSVIWYMTKGVDSLQEIIDNLSLPHGSLIIDGGSNIGLFSALLSKKVGELHSIMVEPIIPYEVVRMNYIPYKFIDAALVSEKDSKDYPMKTMFVSNTSHQSNSLTHDCVTTSTLEENIDKQMVRTVCLKNLITEPIDLLKLDIQGHEYEAIKDINFKLVNSVLVETSFIETENAINTVNLLRDKYENIKTIGYCKGGGDLLFY